MAVLVTRPLPDGETTAADLRARGFEVVAAPMLRFEPFGFSHDAETPYGGTIVTSANAVRAVESQLANSPLLKLPLFTVGERTAAVARAFEQITGIKAEFLDLRISEIVDMPNWVVSFYFPRIVLE